MDDGHQTRLVALERRRCHDSALMQREVVVAGADLDLARRALTFPVSDTYNPDDFEIVEVYDNELLELAPGVKVFPSLAEFLGREVRAESEGDWGWSVVGAVCGEQLGLHPSQVLELRRSLLFDV